VVTRRNFTMEFRVEAAHRAIDSGRTTGEVARELSISESRLRGWVSDERRRIDAARAQGAEPLSLAERTELQRTELLRNHSPLVRRSRGQRRLRLTV
jgi:transposase